MVLSLASRAISLKTSSAAALLLVMGPIPNHATIDEKIVHYAEIYDVDYARLYETVKCESGFDPSIQSLYPDPTGPNGREDSWGIAQIHLPDHPSITRAQALDPDFALDFMAREFSLGHGNNWTCYKNKSTDLAL